MPRSDGSSRCRSCDAEILWRKSRNDKNVPLDVEPIWLVPTEQGEEQNAKGFDEDMTHYYGLKAEEGEEGAILVHVSHFSTCPNADQHRSRGGAAQRGSEHSRSPRGGRSSGGLSAESACPHCGGAIRVDLTPVGPAPRKPHVAPERQADIPF